MHTADWITDILIGEVVSALGVVRDIDHSLSLSLSVYLLLSICGSTALSWTLAAFFFSVSCSFTQSVEPLGRGISP
jgi:hypothetical protein